MAIQDTKTPYEILIRYGNDGSLQGVHALYLRKIILNGEVLKEEAVPAEDVDLEGFETSQIMNETTRSALMRVVALEAEVSALKSQLTAATEAHSQCSDMAASLAKRLAKSDEMIKSLTAE
ncbi:hypothetical protein ASD52_06660 [Ensifer sp. Root142]|uniref:hypothetical protein n=1 Tax=Ensifer sp. Root142 TaxID=1736461 RepID=UPI0007091984|nr:hypothetical protein [Ensifer sp. Root142]KQY71357.1 hypothetical protein ASD52_06660 [Ensifer sp. Root142]